MRTTVRLNREVRTEFATNDMLFGIATFISTMTRDVTLWPGDVIWMGTDSASPDLRHGDGVEIDINGIGTLRNRFVRAEQGSSGRKSQNNPVAGQYRLA